MSEEQRALKISLLLTGNELMSGDIVDSNSAMLAEQLSRHGGSIFYKATVGDDLALLEQEIERISALSDVLVVNGGLGPTVDDMTAEALSNVLGVALVEHPQAMHDLKAWCELKNIAFTSSNAKQAVLPEGIELVHNRTGSAPGFTVSHNACQIFCTPGVPSELRHMFLEEILPRIPLNASSNIKRLRFRMFGMGESGIQQRILNSELSIPPEIELGFRASLPMLELKLQASRKEDYPALERTADSLKGLFGAHIVTEDDRPIARVVLDLLMAQSKRVTFAESCTGGLISSMLTEQNGSSQVFDAGFVTYSNEMKTDMLGVSPETLNEHGAVSEPVVQHMLAGALSRSGADLGVAVSGIAGPSGGTEDKPVGTVWVAWGGAENIQSHCFYFPMGRKRFQVMVAALAFDLVRRELLGLDEAAVYFKERSLKEKV